GAGQRRRPGRSDRTDTIKPAQAGRMMTAWASQARRPKSRVWRFHHACAARLLVLVVAAIKSHRAGSRSAALSEAMRICADDGLCCCSDIHHLVRDWARAGMALMGSRSGGARAGSVLRGDQRDVRLARCAVGPRKRRTVTFVILPLTGLAVGLVGHP